MNAQANSSLRHAEQLPPDMKKHHFSPEKQRVVERIIPVLRDAGCSMAVLFGSFLESGAFRDVDIMVAMGDGRSPSDNDRVYLSQILENATGLSFDVVGTDVPNILLRGEIGRKGYPVILSDDALWEDFRFRAWIDEMDYRPLIERFYSERFGTEQG